MFNMMIRRFFILIILPIIFFSCNNTEEMTPINKRKLAPKISSIYKAEAYNLRINYIIMHYTALDDDLSLKILTGPGVSSHYLVTSREDDPIYKLVDDSNRAWHAGITMYNNRYSMNDSAIGIEVVNLGFLQKVTNTREQLRRMTKTQREDLFFIPYDEYIEYDESQIEKIVYLLKNLVKKLAAQWHLCRPMKTVQKPHRLKL